MIASDPPYCGDLLLTDLLNRYVSGRLGLGNNAAQQMAISVRLLDRHLGRPATLSDLSEELLVHWLRAMRQAGRSPATCNSKRGSLLTLWRYAARLRLCPPAPEVDRFVEPDRLPAVWSLEEVGRLLAAASEERGRWGGVRASLCWRIAIGLIWDTGVRIGSVLRARLASVDIDRGWWHVPAEHCKGGRGDRLFRLHAETMDFIKLSLSHPREMLVPYPRHPRRIFLDLKRILARAGLPSDRSRMFHCLRRTAESYGAAAGGIEWAAAAVGHSVTVARRSYVSPMVAPGPTLADVLPRPIVVRGSAPNTPNESTP